MKRKQKPSTYKLLRVGRGEKFEIEVVRDEDDSCWRLQGSIAGKPFAASFPADFQLDRRNARQFSADFTIMVWPISDAANLFLRRRRQPQTREFKSAVSRRNALQAEQAKKLIGALWAKKK